MRGEKQVGLWHFNMMVRDGFNKLRADGKESLKKGFVKGFYRIWPELCKEGEFRLAGQRVAVPEGMPFLPKKTR
jgi:hypothetical protein